MFRKTTFSSLLLGSLILLSIPPSLGQANILEAEQIVDRNNYLKANTHYEKTNTEVRNALKYKLLGELFKKGQETPPFKLGALSISQMFRRFETVDTMENHSTKTVAGDAERQSDFYLTNRGIVLFNKSTLNYPAETRALLLIHVFLGASGYQDEDYALSLALVIANDLLKPPLPDQQQLNFNLEDLFPNNSEDLFRAAVPPPTGRRGKLDSGSAKEKQLILAGGFTGVGGGDGTSIQMKWNLLANYTGQRISLYPVHQCGAAWGDTTEFIKLILNSELESDSNFKGKPQLVQTGKKKWKVRIPRYLDFQDQIPGSAKVETLGAFCDLDRNFKNGH